MTHLHLPWLEMCVALPLVGATCVGWLRDRNHAYVVNLVFAALTFLCTMGAWQKGIDFVSCPIERQRMRTRFCRHDFLPTHCGNIDDVYDARIADCDIEVS